MNENYAGIKNFLLDIVNMKIKNSQYLQNSKRCLMNL